MRRSRFNPFFRMTRREIKLQSTMGRTWETWRRMNAADRRRARSNLKPLISHILPLEEYASAASSWSRGSDVMKVLLKP